MDTRLKFEKVKPPRSLIFTDVGFCLILGTPFHVQQCPLKFDGWNSNPHNLPCHEVVIFLLADPDIISSRLYPPLQPMSPRYPQEIPTIPPITTHVTMISPGNPNDILIYHHITIIIRKAQVHPVQNG